MTNEKTPRGLDSPRTGRIVFWWVAVAIMFLMGLSRVYLGVHFPSDVIVGWNGKKVANLQELSDALKAHKPGDQVKLKVIAKC